MDSDVPRINDKARWLLACAGSFSPANMFAAFTGLPGRMDRVEQMKEKRVEPLLRLASKSVASSRLPLAGVVSSKGAHVRKGFLCSVKSLALTRSHFA